MTTRNDIEALETHLQRTLASSAYRRPSVGKPPPSIPFPPSPIDPRSVAAFIIRAGRRARGEEPEGQDGDLDDLEEGEGNG